MPYAGLVQRVLRVSTLVLLLSACGGSAAAPPTPTVPPPTAVPTVAPTPTVELTVYTVQPGDSLTAISNSTHRSVDAIMKTNNMTDPNKLTAGQS